MGVVGMLHGVPRTRMKQYILQVTRKGAPQVGYAQLQVVAPSKKYIRDNIRYYISNEYKLVNIVEIR